MALRLEQKQTIVTEVNDAAKQGLAAVLVDYRGMSAVELADLRRRARASGVYLRVVRNSLLKRAVADTRFECLAQAAAGPTMLAFSTEEPGAAARLFKGVATEFDTLAVKALSVDGRMLPAEQLDRLASLPTREEAIAQLMAVIQAPMAKLARTLQEVPAKLARVLAAVGESKG